MTSTSASPSAAAPAGTAAPDAAPTVEVSCCRKPMSSIAVTTRGASLTLHSCSACGRHIWAKDGVFADRAELLDGVKTFLEQPREKVRRRSARRAAAEAAEEAAAAAARAARR